MNTENRKKAFKEVAKTLKSQRKWDKGRAVQYLLEEDIYSQKQDCKDFIKNIVRASNTEVCSVSERKIALTGKSVVNV